MTALEYTWLADVWTVLRKELRELTMALIACRVTLCVFALSALVMSALLVVCAATGWRSGLLLLLIWLLVPVAPTTVALAESLAGEREHGTIESLLMTPLSPVALLAGKMAAAATFGWVATIFALLLSMGMIGLLGLGPQVTAPNAVVMLALSFLSAMLAASAGSYVIANVATVRQAYVRLGWIAGLLVLGLALILTFVEGLLPTVSNALEGGTGASLAPLAGLSIILLGTDAALYAVAALHFRRKELLAD